MSLPFRTPRRRRRAPFPSSATHLAAGEAARLSHRDGVRPGLVRPTEAALTALAQLKGRPPKKPFLLLVSSEQMAGGVGPRLLARGGALAAAFWPGPLTLCCTGGEGRLPDRLRGAEGGIARAIHVASRHRAISSKLRRSAHVHLGQPPRRARPPPAPRASSTLFARRGASRGPARARRRRARERAARPRSSTARSRCRASSARVPSRAASFAARSGVSRRDRRTGPARAAPCPPRLHGEHLPQPAGRGAAPAGAGRSAGVTDVDVSSAGTGAWEGAPASEGRVPRGAGERARPVRAPRAPAHSATWSSRSDLILTMSRHHRARVLELGAEGQVHLLGRVRRPLRWSPPRCADPVRRRPRRVSPDARRARRADARWSPPAWPRSARRARAVGRASSRCSGDPVAHSLSPAMQNAAFRVLGLDAVYVPLRCAAEHVPVLMRGARGGRRRRQRDGAAQGGRGHGASTRPTERVARSAPATPSGGTEWRARPATAPTSRACWRRSTRLAVPRPRRGSWSAPAARRTRSRRRPAWPGRRLAVSSRDPARAAAFLAWAGGRGVGIASAEEATPGDQRHAARPERGRPAPHPARGDARAPWRRSTWCTAPGRPAWVRAQRQAGRRAADGREVLLAQGAAAFTRWFPKQTPPLDVMRAAVHAALD